MLPTPAIKPKHATSTAGGIGSPIAIAKTSHSKKPFSLPTQKLKYS
jgi:hypothetical protein